MREEPMVCVDLKESEGTCTFSINADEYEIDKIDEWVHVIRKGKKVASFKTRLVDSIYVTAITEEETE